MAQETIPARLTGRAASTPTTSSKARWRWAGGFGLAHIILVLAAFSFEGVAVEHGAAASRVLHLYGGVSVTRVEVGSYVEAMAFLPLVAALVVLARLISRTETARTAGQVALGLGVAYVASTFAVGFPPLTAAVYAAHHGVDAGALATVNDVRNYAFVLQVALSMAFTLALGIAALADRSLTKWGGYAGVAIGAGGLVATPFVHNGMSMVQMIWWVGLSILCLKGGPRDSHEDVPGQSASEPGRVG
jgi:hypothetical protein